MEDIDGGLHPAVDGQSLDEMRMLGAIESSGFGQEYAQSKMVRTSRL